MPRAGVTVVAVACALWGVALVASSRDAAPRPRYIDGAPPGFAGGFGEPSCHACHFSAEPNTPPGRVSLSGVPATWSAGRVYQVTITLTRPGLVIGGFQLSVRFRNGGGQAGALAVPAAEAERVRIDGRDGVQYASQRRGGAAAATPGAARWTVDWTAPSSGDAVIFHVAANAADKDDSAMGDFAYTESRESGAGRP